MGKTQGDLKRGQISRWPHELTVLTDSKDPMYDARVKLPLKDEAILNLAAIGFVQAIAIRPRGSETLIVDGLQRVKRALVINHLAGAHEYDGTVQSVKEAIKRLSGDDSAIGKRVVQLCPKGVKCPVIVNRASNDAGAYAAKVSANWFREADPLVEQARKVQRLLQLGHSVEDCAEQFGCHVATIKRWAKMDTEKERPPRKARTKSARPTIKMIGKAHETANGKVKALLAWVCGKGSFEDAVKAFPELDAS